MTYDELMDAIELADEDLIRSVTDEMVESEYATDAEEKSESGSHAAIDFLISRGHSVEALVQLLRGIGAIQ